MTFATKYTEFQKEEAATSYAVLGSARKVSKLTDIPERTIREWTTREWWEEMVGAARKRHQDKLDGRLTGIINKTTDQLLDRVVNGDKTVNPKTGEMVRKPMSGRDLAASFALLLDRRQVIRGDPSRITKATNIDKQMADIQKKMEKRTEESKEKVVDAPTHTTSGYMDVNTVQ